MKERPILFSAPMVRALLAGTKTQTRRIVKPQPDVGAHGIAIVFTEADRRLGRLGTTVRCPYGQPGDRLWVRETFMGWYNASDKSFSHVAAFRADGYELRSGERWTPAIHMPRAAARITLEVIGIRVKRLQDTSEADAQAEGIEQVMSGRWRIYGRETDGRDMDSSARTSYRSLWASINGPGSWEANPWVWVVEFKPFNDVLCGPPSAARTS